jgi:type IV secretion system protein TrbL
VVITWSGLLLEITDQLAVGIVQATGNTMESMGDKHRPPRRRVRRGSTSPRPVSGAIITIFLAGLAISAAAIVWFSLLIRKALLLVAIVFAPIALAGFSWDATKGWFGKWATFVIALILSKLVLVVIFLVAITQVSAPIELDLASISDPIAGVVLMFIAAFAPYMTYKFVTFIGFDMYHSMSAEQEAKSALNRPVPVPSAPKTDGAKKVLDGAGDTPASGGKSGGGAPAVGAPNASTAAPAAGSGAAAGGSAGASAAGAGGGAGAAGAGAGAGAAAAGPAAAVVVGAQVAKAAATAGPKLGGAVGGAAEGHAAGAGETVQPAPSPNPAPTAPTRPSPSAPLAKSPPPAPAPKPSVGKE